MTEPINPYDLLQLNKFKLNVTLQGHLLEDEEEFRVGQHPFGAGKYMKHSDRIGRAPHP